MTTTLASGDFGDMGGDFGGGDFGDVGSDFGDVGDVGDFGDATFDAPEADLSAETELPLLDDAFDAAPLEAPAEEWATPDAADAEVDLTDGLGVEASADELALESEAAPPTDTTDEPLDLADGLDLEAETDTLAEEQATLEAEEQAALEAEEQATLEAEEQAALEAEEQATLEAEEQATLEAEEQATLEAEEQAALEAEEQAADEVEPQYTDPRHEKGEALESGYHNYLENQDNLVVLPRHDLVTTPGFDTVYYNKDTGHVSVVEGKNYGSEEHPGYVSDISAWREDRWNKNMDTTREQIEHSSLPDDVKDGMMAAIYNGAVDRELVIGKDTRVSDARLDENQVGRLVQFDPAAGDLLRVHEVPKGK